MDRQNRQTWIAATAVILTGVGTTWWTGRRMITREDVDDLRTEIAAWHRSADEQMQEQRAYMAQHGYISQKGGYGQVHWRSGTAA